MPERTKTDRNTKEESIDIDNIVDHCRSEENVMLVYIRVFVVLTWSLCRKEREKLDITLDRHSVCLQS